MINSEAKEIKDSGNRRKFETGAVRDIQDNKGRCDLLPLDVVAKLTSFFDISLYGQDMVEDILYCVRNFTETNDVEFLCVALKDFSLLNHQDFSTMMLEVSIHFEQGAKKYGEYNWQKGIPVNCYIDSAIRHFLKFLRGDEDEPHDRAFVWNIMCCIWEVMHNGRKDNKTAENRNTES